MGPTSVAFRFTSYSLRQSTSTIIPGLRQLHHQHQKHISDFRPFSKSRNLSTTRYNLNKMTSTPSESLEELCNRVQTILPEQFRNDAWYLIVVSSPSPFLLISTLLIIH